MSRWELETTIDALLGRVADALGYSRAKRALYAPVRPTGFTDVKAIVFPKAGIPKQKLSAAMFAEVRHCLTEAVDDAGRPCLTGEDLLRLDRAWERYDSAVAPVPADVPKRWYRLVHEGVVTRDRLVGRDNIMGLLDELLYQPMLLCDYKTFTVNANMLAAALKNRSEMVPADCDAYDDLVDRCLVVTAFCCCRFEDPREMAVLLGMKKRSKKRKSALLASTLLSHDFLHNQRSLGASHAMKIGLDGGDVGWGKSFGTSGLGGRAAISAAYRGFDWDERPTDLHGLSVREALNGCVNELLAADRKVEASIFETIGLRVDAQRGRLDEVLSRTQAIKHRFVDYKVYPNLESGILLTQSEAYYAASKGQRSAELLAAGDLAEEFLRLRQKSGFRRRACEREYLQRVGSSCRQVYDNRAIESMLW